MPHSPLQSLLDCNGARYGFTVLNPGSVRSDMLSHLLQDIRDDQPGSNSNQTRKRTFLWIRSRFCKVEPFRCHSYCFHHGPSVTASVHCCDSNLAL